MYKGKFAMIFRYDDDTELKTYGNEPVECIRKGIKKADDRDISIVWYNTLTDDDYISGKYRGEMMENNNIGKSSAIRWRALYNRNGKYYLTDASLVYNGRVEMMEFPVSRLGKNDWGDLFGIGTPKINFGKGVVLKNVPLEQWTDDMFTDTLKEAGVNVDEAFIESMG